MNNLEMLELELKNTKSIIELKDKENSLMSKDVSLLLLLCYYTIPYLFVYNIFINCIYLFLVYIVWKFN